MGVDKLIKYLALFDPLNKESVKNVQRALAGITNENGKPLYTNNLAYTRDKKDIDDGTDGKFGPRSRRDLCDCLKANPEALTSMSQSLKKELINNGMAGELAQIVKDNPTLRATLKQEVDDILEGRPLKDLTATELEKVQANWSMMGLYPPHLEVDGIPGPGTRKAHDLQIGRSAQSESMHKHTNVSSTATDSTNTVTTSTYTTGELSNKFNYCVDDTFSNLKRNGDFGVPLEAIEAVWDAIKTGKKLEPISHEGTGKTLYVFDPGHGAKSSHESHHHDKGAAADGLTEMDIVDPFMLDAARKVYACGGDVAFTRNPFEYFDDAFTYKNSLGARALFANMLAEYLGYEHVVLVSGHANASANIHDTGTQVYTAQYGKQNGKVDFGTPDEAINPRSRKLAGCVAGNVNITGKPTTEHSFDATVVRNFETYKSTDEHCSVKTRQGFLLEVGYVTGADKEVLRQASQNPDTLGTQVANGLMEYSYDYGLLTPPFSPSSEKEYISHNVRPGGGMGGGFTAGGG